MTVPSSAVPEIVFEELKVEHFSLSKSNPPVSSSSPAKTEPAYETAVNEKTVINVKILNSTFLMIYTASFPFAMEFYLQERLYNNIVTELLHTAYY